MARRTVAAAPTLGVGWHSIDNHKPGASGRIHRVYLNGKPCCQVWNNEYGMAGARLMSFEEFLAHPAACSFCKRLG